MSLQEYYVLTGYSFFFYGLFLFILMVALLLLQVWTLSRRLDVHLFNENYFTQQEIAMFSSFPLSLLKTLAYIRLITFPNSLRKRFGDATARDKISIFDLFISHLTMLILSIEVLILLNFIFAMMLNYILLEFVDGAGEV